MHDLNPQQIVLLTLLVSFVTSIATGITTVSLLEQAPAPVTQTINRVIEKTIETITPEPDPDNTTTVKTPTKEIVTTIVNNEDLTIEAVSKNSRSLARIYQKNGSEEIFIGLGIVFDNIGRLVTDASVIQKNGKYIAVYQSGKYNLVPVYRELNDPYAILKIADDQNAPTDFSPASFADSQNLKLAQSVISLSGIKTNTVATGIITNLESVSGALQKEEIAPNAQPNQQFKLIETSVDKSNVLLGSIILNLKGEIVGVRINNDLNRLNTFTPSNNITNFLNGK
jgi:putative serine protease PepD